MENETKPDATCEQELSAIRDSLEILGGKWKLRIMRHLNNHIAETNTFKKIQREVGRHICKNAFQRIAGFGNQPACYQGGIEYPAGYGEIYDNSLRSKCFPDYGGIG